MGLKMFSKLSAGINLFRKGSEVANAELWTNGGITAGALGAALLALVQFGDAFGLHIPITADQANGLAGGIIAVVGIVLPIITSKRAGILPAKPTDAASPGDQPEPEPVRAVAAPAAPQPVQPVRRAANGDALDEPSPLRGLDTTYVA
jgi:hypothetical protein